MTSQEPNYPCDMHCHTLRSDGNDTPLELIENAAAAGMHAVAITDHDIDPPLTVDLPDGRQGKTVEYAAGLGVVLVLGYEFSCDTLVDDVHICGYRLDWSHGGLQAEVAAAKLSKSRAYEQLCKALTLNGMPVDWEADVLAGIRQPDEVQRKHVFEAMAARGHAETWSDAKIIVRDDPALNIRRRKIDPLDAIALIKRCGGTAVLAHPYLIDEEVQPSDGQALTRAAYIDRLIDGGLDGIEARYTYDKTSYKGMLTPEQIEAEVRSTYTGRVSFFSGGSDYHAGHKKNAKRPRSLGERGLTIEEFQEAFG
jgi:hypothetical protein